MGEDIVEIGHLPSLGILPDQMYAQTIRQSRFGDPRGAFEVERIGIPSLKNGEVLIAVMAAGINFNNVWAAQGIPIDIIAARQKAGEIYDFHIGGSDASGIVWAVGEDVTSVTLGDEVVIHPGWWDENDPWIVSGKDPIISSSASIWGYDTNFGSFGQFAVVQAHQCLPKAPHLSWEEAAGPTLVGTTAYRMLFGWPPNTVEEGDAVLIWGGSGGLGSQAIQLVKGGGGLPIAVVSDHDRGAFCEKLGAVGWIDRREFDHWGIPPHWSDTDGQAAWTKQARTFGKKIWDIIGERKNPAIVFEHPGEATIPTSIFVCEGGGMVVICAGTTGYSAMVDLRHQWTRQKRLQGSHGTNDEQASRYNALVCAKEIDPCLGRVVSFTEIPQAHYEMMRGSGECGNTVALVGAAEPGLGKR